MADTPPLAKQILTALAARHPWPEWIFLPELYVGTGLLGYRRLDAWAWCLAPWSQPPLFAPVPADAPPSEAAAGDSLVLDAWAQDTYPSQRLRRITYEIKVSRADFTRELRAPTKTAAGLAASNEFYWATPPGLLDGYILPPETGWIECFPDGYARMRMRAPWRKTEPSWAFVAALVRRACELPPPR